MKNLYRTVLLMVLAYFPYSGIHAQVSVKALGNGLSKGVICSCADTLGNLYAVTKNTNDTIVVNRWNDSNQNWSVYTKLTAFLDPKTCQFLNGKFYLAAINPFSAYSNVAELWEFSAGNWNVRGYFSFNHGMQFIDYHMASVRYKNRLYFAGNFDSAGYTINPNVIAYDQNGFASVGSLPNGTGRGRPSFALMGDSLFLMMGNSVFLFNGNNTWSVYYTTNSFYYYYNTMAVNNHILYITNDEEIQLVKNGGMIDTIRYFTSGHISLVAHNKKVYVANGRGGDNSIYQIENKKDLSFLFNNELDDTANQPFFSSNGRLYYHPSAGVKVNGTNYKYIVKLVDSVKPIKFDTIVGFVFWDKNNNFKKDGNDAWPYSGAVKNMKGNYSIPLTANTGMFTDVVLENSVAEYRVLLANYDSCVKTYFSGDIKARNMDTGVTTDSVYIPMVKPSNQFLNLVVNNQSSVRARLMDSVTLTFNIKNEDCSAINTSNVKLTVRLDTNALFLGSSPAYTSKSGNVVTFSGLTVNYATDNLIKLKVWYPNSKLSIGDKVRHYAALDNISGEDSTGNQDSIIQRMVYSYDPNSKHSEPEGKITSDLKKIRYTIDFQNLGNDEAIKVTIVDTLDMKMPVYDFQMRGATHAYSISLVPGTSVVVWTFDNIHLAPKSKNEAASKGQIVFEAKVWGSLRVGDSIRNKAYIYFDYNQPVITNYAVINRVEKKDNVNEVYFVKNGSLKAYPNPGQDFVNFENTLGNRQQVNVYDMKGACILVFQLNGFETKKIDTGHWARGVYMIVNEKGEGSKIVIE